MRKGLFRSACRPAKALPALAAAAALGLGACGSSGSSSGSSTSTTVKQTLLANEDASPAGAVSNYLGALSKHDPGLAMMFLHPKSEKSIVAAAGSGFAHLVSLDDVKVGPALTGKQFQPNVDGYTFSKDTQFAQVTVSYTVTFSSGQSGSGPQSRVVTLGENAHARWLILVIRTT
jgi:hypothetical protein